MTLLHLIALSIVQGLTEFLPVSSSGHLILFSKLAHFQDQGVGIDVALHIGSLIAVVLYFKSEICQMITEVLQNKLYPNFKLTYNKLAYLLALASLPALIVGFLLRHHGMAYLRNPQIIGFTILFYGILLYIADRFCKSEKGLKEIGVKESLLIGFAQCLALIPGTSRSGITITTARFLKINRIDAAKFSMLLSIPVIFAAGALELYRLIIFSQTTDLLLSMQAIFFSFIFSYIVIYLMMKWLQRWSYLPFVIYRIILGTALILLL